MSILIGKVAAEIYPQEGKSANVWKCLGLCSRHLVAEEFGGKIGFIPNFSAQNNPNKLVIDFGKKNQRNGTMSQLVVGIKQLSIFVHQFYNFLTNGKSFGRDTCFWYERGVLTSKICVKCGQINKGMIG